MSHPFLKILILKPSSLGDIIQALPVVRIIRRRIEDVRISWWVDADFLPLLEADPEIDRLYVFYRRDWWKPLSLWRNLRVIASMRARSFDLAIDLQALLRSAVVGYLSGARTLIGLDDPREGAPAFYYQAIPRPADRPHAVDWYLATLDAIHIPPRWDFVWLPLNRHASASVRKRLPASDGCMRIAVVPGGSWPSKRWPAYRFAELIEQLARYDSRLHFLILGNPAEWEIAMRVAAGAPERCTVLAGTLTLPELVETLRLSSLLITNDSGPMHIAAALRRPVIAIFGPTDPRRTGPYGQPHNVITAGIECQPCLMRRCPLYDEALCMQRVSVQAVLHHTVELINSGQSFVNAPWMTVDSENRMIPGIPTSDSVQETSLQVHTTVDHHDQA